MGVVYRAHDSESARVVALKTVRRPSGDDLYHLKEEFRALADLSHPNLVELHELFVDGDLSYFTMEVIEGSGILEHLWGDGTTATGPGIPPDGIARLDAVLPSVVEGIAAVHEGGRLHRDLKPSNVMVTWEGRAVVLDFGLAVAWRDAALDPSSSSYGTQRYMSPEQLRGEALTPASDWFALGVLVFEALTGTLPYRGTAAEIVEQQLRGAPSPAALVPAIPERLDALVRRLLHPTPAERPDYLEILRLLQARPEVRSSLRMMVPVEAPFLGRRRELDALHASLGALDSQGCAFVTVEGVSGIGKTEMLRRFLISLEGDAGTVILRGRCQPRESVRFKAFDGLVDALSRYLRRLGARAADLRPDDLRDLLRLFPVLARVPGFEPSQAADDVPSVEDPRVVRRRAFAALRQVFAALGASSRVVLWIDDVHWADEDSAALLRALLEPPSTPRLLVIASWQRELRDASAMVAALESLGRALPPSAVTALSVEPLGAADARGLARKIVGDRQLDLDLLIAESGGAPYYLTELCKRARELPPEAARRLRVSEVIGERLAALPAVERTLLECVAVAGRPVPRGLLVRAAGVGGSARGALLRLGELRLGRSTTLRDAEVIEIWHDRVRAAVIEACTPERRRETHAKLAEAMQASEGADPEALVLHLQGAGDPVRAAGFAVAAAQQAEDALAFERAAALYGVALANPPPGASVSDLWRRRADALVSAGRGAAAADAFVRAADTAGGASADDVLDLRRRAAEQFLFSGRYEEGIRVMQVVLEAVGVTLPRSPRAAMASALLGRTRFMARSLAPSMGRGRTRVSAQRLDALWTACASLSMVQPALADAMGVQHLLESLDLGDPSRAVRALGYEATTESSLGGAFFRGRSRKLLEEASRLAESTGRPYDRAWSLMAEGTTAWLEGRWERALDRCGAALAVYTRECRGVAWETATSRIYLLSSLALSGRFAELGRRMPEALNEAEAHGDRFGLGGYCVGQQGLHWVASGDLDAWRALAERARSTWLPGSFHLQRYSYLVAATQADLARGDGWGAFRRITSEWAALEAAQFLRLEVPSVELLQLRARAALSCTGRHGPSSQPGWSRSRLLALVHDAATRIARCPLPFAAPTAALLRAGHAAREGRPERARAELAAAGGGFAAAGMEAHRALADWELASVGARSAPVPAATAAWAAREGVGDLAGLRRALLWVNP